MIKSIPKVTKITRLRFALAFFSGELFLFRFIYLLFVNI